MPALDPINSPRGGSPDINFRPDPGEPAVRLSAPANQTALLVSAQELRNETRLRSRALANGDEVLFSNRTFTPGVEGGDSAIVAGLTSVTFREGANRPDIGLQDQVTISDEARDALVGNPLETEGAGEDAENQTASPIEQAREEAEEDADPTAPREEKDIAEDEDIVEREREGVQNDREEAEREEEDGQREGSPVAVQQARAEQARLDLEERELDRQERRLDVEKLASRLRELNEGIGTALTGNADAAAGPLAALYNGGNPATGPQRGGLLDLIA